MSGNGNGGNDFEYRDTRSVVLDDDDLLPPEEVLKNIGAVQARVGDNVATDTQTAKYGPKGGPERGAVKIGGAAGYAEGDVLTRFDGATAYDEASKMGGKATGTGAETAARARALAEHAAGGKPWEYRLDPVYRQNATGQMVAVPGQQNIVFVPDDLVVSRSTVSDRYGIVQPAAWDEAMDTVTAAVGRVFGERPKVSRNMLWADRSTYMVQTAPLPKGIRLPSGGDLELRLMALGGCDGTKGGSLLLDGRVPGCRNVLQSIMRSAKLRWTLKHLGDAAGRLALAADVLAAEMTSRLPALEGTIFKMGQTKVTDKALAVSLALLLGKVDEDQNLVLSNRAKSTARKLLRAYTDAPAAQPGTQWGALQMASYHATHEHGGAKRHSQEERVYCATAATFDDRYLSALDKAMGLEQVGFAGETDAAAANRVYQQVSLATFA